MTSTTTTPRLNVQPQSPRAIKIRTADGYKRVIAHKLGAAWVIAWVRPGYAMFKTGAKGEWATICTHGKVQRTTKGAKAEQAGRERGTWCPACKTA
jgi:hypothetical protein